MSSFVPRAKPLVHISLRDEHTFGSMHDVALPPGRFARGKGAGSHGLPGQGQRAREGARTAGAESHARRHRADLGCIEVVGLAVGPGRPLHADAPATWPAPASTSRARSEVPPDRGAE